MTVETVNTSPSSGLRVLVVEDQALIAEEIRERLTRIGASTVAVAHSGIRAIEVARKERPDLVLMDIRLNGEMDGIEAATLIRENADIPVVYVTAHSDSATLQRARETTPYGYVLKPFREKEFQIAIEMAVERHALEKRENDQRLTHTLAAVGYAVIVVDSSGIVKFINPVAEWLTKWECSEATGRSILEVFAIAPESNPVLPEHPVTTALGIDASSPQTFSFVMSNRSRLAIAIEGITNVIRDSKGRVTGAVAAFRHVPAGQPDENIPSVQDHLLKIQRMETVTRLAGGVAHEFNNILAVISGNAQLLRMKPAAPESPSKVDAILRATNRGASVVRQLMVFSQTNVDELEAVDVNFAVRQAKSQLAVTAGDGSALEINLRPRLSLINGDDSLLEQLIVNIGINACEAMPNGGLLTIDTAERKVEGGGREVTITISDTGRGIVPLADRSLFEPFFTTKDVAHTAGLGLAVAYGVVKQFGGRIEYRTNRAGRGTTFIASFPAIDAATLHGFGSLSTFRSPFF